MCNCTELSESEAASFDSEFDLVKGQRDSKVLARIKHDVEIDAAKIAMFDELVTAVTLQQSGCMVFGPAIEELIEEAKKLQRGELP